MQQSTNDSRIRSRNLIIGRSDATRGAKLQEVKLDAQTRHKLAIMKRLSKITLFEKIWYFVFIVGGILCLTLIKPFNFQLVFAVLSLYLYMISNVW